MVFLLLVSVLFSRTPYLHYSGGWDELKWCQLAHNQLICPQGPHFSPHSTAKTTIKAQISGKIVSSGTSVVAFSSVRMDKTHLKKLTIMIIIMNKSQEVTVFHGRQKLTSAIKVRPEK